MARLRGSFLIRWWALDGDGDGSRSRIELEHIQTGARTVAGSLAEALDWIGESAAGRNPSEGGLGREAMRREAKGGCPDS